MFLTRIIPMRQLVTLLVALSAGVLLQAAADGQPAAREDPAVRAARARQEAVKTVAVRLKRTEVIAKGGLTLKLSPPMRPPMPAPLKEMTLESTTRLVLDRDKVRAESNDPRLQLLPNNTAEVTRREFLGSFDGTTTKLLFPIGIGGHGPPRGMIHKDNGRDSLGMIDAFPITMAFRGLSPVLAHPRLDQLEPTGEIAMIDGSLCLEYTPAPATKSARRFWLDTAKDHVLLRLQESRRSQITDVQYRRDKAIGWVPASWVRKQYGPDGDLLSTTTVVVQEMVFNTPQPAEQFDLAFPVGAHVDDYRPTRYKKYLVQADGNLRWLPEPGEEPLPPWYEGNEWLLAGVGGILLALGLAYLRQKRRRNARRGCEGENQSPER
jgi:hypothetical protein